MTDPRTGPSILAGTMPAGTGESAPRRRTAHIDHFMQREIHDRAERLRPQQRTRAAASRDPRHRLQPLSRRPVPVAMPRVHGRGGHQGRAPDPRRRRAGAPLFHRRAQRLLPAAEHGQAGALRERAGAARARADASARRRRGCLRRELSAGGARPARARLCEPVGAQSAARVLFDLGLRPQRPGFGQSGLRSDRRGEERRDGHDRSPRGGAAAVPDRARRHVHRYPRGGRGQRGAARPRDERARPAHRPRSLRLHGLHPRIRGAVLHAERRRGDPGRRPVTICPSPPCTACFPGATATS